MPIVDVAIVGGGVAGCFAGWRLTAPGADRSVALFERGERIGGRLFSVAPEGMPHLRAELGGMRFMTSQLFVSSLVEHLGLATHPFMGGDPAGIDNFYYLRGRRLAREDWEQHPDRIPYFLRPEERGVAPAELYMRVLKDVLPADLAALRTATWRGRALADIGWSNLFRGLCSQEAFHMLADVFGYDQLNGNWNVAENVEHLLTNGARPHRVLTISDGMQSLPLELSRRFVEQGGALHQGRELRRVDRAEGGHLRLTFRDGEAVEARHVVLALPRRAIELLDRDCFLFDDARFLEDLQAVVPQKASKLFLSFREPWWEAVGMKSGRTDTDLPLRQCFYFGTEGDEPGAPAGNRNSLLMAGYASGNSVEFWSGYLGHSIYDRSLYHGAGRPESPEIEDVPPSMVAEARAQLSEIHGVEVPEPYAAFFTDWEREPYGGGTHTWRIHARAWEIRPRMRQPFGDAPLYVCGEAWSNNNGWVEGALNSAELVLEEKLGCPRPAYLPAEHALGD